MQFKSCSVAFAIFMHAGIAETEQSKIHQAGAALHGALGWMDVCHFTGWLQPSCCPRPMPSFVVHAASLALMTTAEYSIATTTDAPASTSSHVAQSTDPSPTAIKTDLAKHPSRNKSSNGTSSRQRREDPPDVKISKTLSYILRHGAAKEGLVMRSDGYIKVDDLVGAVIRWK